MTVATLHFDVLHCMIGDIHRNGDVATLITCAQVCRQWHIVGRRLIFREILLSTGTRLAQLEDILLSNSDIGPLVEKLRIHPRVLDNVPTVSRWIIDIPRILPAKLENLRHIELVGLYENGRYCPEAFFRGFCKFTAVERLTVRDSAMVVNLLYAFIASLPNLKHVSVGFMRPLIASVFPYPVQLLDPKFTSLDLSIGTAYPSGLKSILDWVTQTSARITLRSLHLDIYEEQVVDAGDFLSESGQLLEQLSLNIIPLGTPITTTSNEPTITTNNLSVAACRSLKALTLRPFDTPSTTMLSFIEEISSSSLQELKLVITRIVTPQSEKMPAMDMLAARLCDHRLGGLENLTCLYDGPPNESAVLEYLQAGLAVVPIHVRNNIRVTVMRNDST